MKKFTWIAVVLFALSSAQVIAGEEIEPVKLWVGFNHSDCSKRGGGWACTTDASTTETLIKLEKSDSSGSITGRSFLSHKFDFGNRSVEWELSVDIFKEDDGSWLLFVWADGAQGDDWLLHLNTTYRSLDDLRTLGDTEIYGSTHWEGTEGYTPYFRINSQPDPENAPRIKTTRFPR